jgi:hypothetical protein
LKVLLQRDRKRFQQLNIPKTALFDRMEPDGDPARENESGSLAGGFKKTGHQRHHPTPIASGLVLTLRIAGLSIQNGSEAESE